MLPESCSNTGKPLAVRAILLCQICVQLFKFFFIISFCSGHNQSFSVNHIEVFSFRFQSFLLGSLKNGVHQHLSTKTLKLNISIKELPILTFITSGPSEMLLFSFVDKSVNKSLIQWSYSFTLRYQNCIIYLLINKKQISFSFFNLYKDN